LAGTTHLATAADAPRKTTHQDFGTVQDEAVWRDYHKRPVTRLLVCWENPDPKHSSQREAVRRAIADSWQRHSALVFEGWDGCASHAKADIRIAVADVNPHTRGLGTKLRNVTRGMVLNFDFSIWGEPCGRPDVYELCLKAIAVHEFGHAIGFAHEHNRDDRDESCLEKPQGTKGNVNLTPYDPASVMNYCNPTYGNHGELSPLDIESVQKLYGKPSESAA
jgi:hypothetical protein